MKLKVKNPLNNAIRTTHDVNEIDSPLMQNNRKHLPKVKKIASYRDKIIKKLNKSSTSNKILKGEAQQEGVDNANVFEFLKLLECKSKKLPAKEFKPLAVED